MMTTKAHGPAAQRLGFTIHALAFVPAMLAMVIVNALTGPPWWVVWPALGWSVGLLAHGWFVHGPGARRSGARP